MIHVALHEMKKHKISLPGGDRSEANDLSDKMRCTTNLIAGFRQTLMY